MQFSDQSLRTLDFDVQALGDEAAKTIGAADCETISLVTEGN